MIAGAVASPAAALLTSRFGVAGTMIGLALSAVVVTVISDVLKVYLQRAPGAVTRIEGGFTKRPRWQRPFYRLRHPFSKFSSLAPAQRRSILIRSVIAGGIMFVIGLVVVTGLELSVGKDLSCWVWNNCATETSASGSSASNTYTLPSILGGGRSTGRNPLQVVAPVPVQQQPASPPGNQGTLKQPSSPPIPGQSSSSSSSQKQNSPSSGNQQQQSGYEQTTESQQQGEYQQQSSYEQTTQTAQQNEYQEQSANQQQTKNSEQTTENPQQQGEYQQENPPSNQESQQPSLSSSNPENQQQTPTDSSNSGQQKASQQ